MQHEPLTFAWLLNELRQRGVDSLDAALASRGDEPGMAEVLGAVRLSAHVLRAAPEQLAGQLLGRLLGSTTPEVVALLEEAAEWRERAWLRPRARNLMGPSKALVRMLTADRFYLTSLCASPDGRRVISGHGTGFVHIWDVESGRLVQSFRAQDSAVTCMALTADGRRLAVGSGGWQMRFWDLEREELIAVLPGRTTHHVKALTVTPNGRRLISGGNDQTVRIWDLETSELLYVLRGHSGEVRAVAVTADGRWVVSVSSGRDLRIWDSKDIEAGEYDAESIQPAGDTGAVGVAAVADYVPGSQDGSGVSVNDISVNGNGLDAQWAGVFSDLSLAIAPGSTTLAVAGIGEDVQIWDIPSRQLVRTIPLPDDPAYAVALTLDGRRLITSAARGVLRIWDTHTGRQIGELAIGDGYVREMAMFADGRHVITGDGAMPLKIWDLDAAGDALLPRRHGAWARHVAVSRDGRLAVSGADDGSLWVWDARRGAVVHTVEGHNGQISGVALTPDGTLFVSGAEDGPPRVWNSQSGTLVRVLEGDDVLETTAVAVTPDGTRVVAGVTTQAAFRLRVWDSMSGHVQSTVDHPDESAVYVAIASDGQRVLTVSNDDRVHIWNVATGTPLEWIGERGRLVNTAAFTPDGQQVVISDHDGGVRVWDLTEGRTAYTRLDQRWHMSRLALLPGGTRVVTTNLLCGEVRVTDLESGDVVATFTCDSGTMGCAVAEDGTIVVTDTAGVVHFFDLVEPSVDHVLATADREAAVQGRGQALGSGGDYP